MKPRPVSYSLRDRSSDRSRALAGDNGTVHIHGMDGVFCGNCGRLLEEAGGLQPDERAPCPACGSMARNFRVHLSDTLHAEASFSATVTSADVQSISAIADLLLQGVIVHGAKNDEGRLIAAVAIPWFDIIDILKNDPAAAYQIPPDRWEEIIAGAYCKAGFDEVILTPRSGDYGRDVIAIKKGLGSIRVIDQVKAYKPGHLVTANDVRALMGVLQGDGASKGFLTTTSDFAPLLRTDPFIVPFMPSRLELVNGKQLLAALEELATRTKP